MALLQFYRALPMDLECTVMLSSTEAVIHLSVLSYLKTFALTCLLEAPFILLNSINSSVDA